MEGSTMSFEDYGDLQPFDDRTSNPAIPPPSVDKNPDPASNSISKSDFISDHGSSTEFEHDTNSSAPSTESIVTTNSALSSADTALTSSDSLSSNQVVNLNSNPNSSSNSNSSLKKPIPKPKPSLQQIPESPSTTSASNSSTTQPSTTASPSANSSDLGPHQPFNQREIDSRSIFISNLPFRTTPYRLKSLFNLGTESIPGCGENAVNRVTIICDRKTGLPKGFAYLEFSHINHLNLALNFNDYELNGRIINVVQKRTNLPNLNNSSNYSGALDINANNHVHNTANNNTNNNTNNTTTTTTNNNNNSDDNNETSLIDGYHGRLIKNHKNSNYNYIKNNKHKFNKLKNNSNNNRNNNNNNQSSTNKHSKLVIDDNHYLTPSSRVGVYNN